MVPRWTADKAVRKESGSSVTARWSIATANTSPSRIAGMMAPDGPKISLIEEPSAQVKQGILDSKAWLTTRKGTLKPTHDAAAGALKHCK
jgi:hypothetical protein